jgi:hypothetical protein
VRGYHKRVAKYYSAVLGAVLGLFSLTFGQTGPEKKEDAPGSVQTEALKSRKVKGVTVIKGTITDLNGAVIAGAEVIVKINDKEMSSVKTNEDGEYRVSYLDPGNLTISVSSPGFKTYKKEGLPIHKDEELQLDITLNVNPDTLMGVIVVTEAPIEVKENTDDKTHIEKVNDPSRKTSIILTGTVVDANGAVIPNAKVTVTVKDGKELSYNSNSNGSYEMTLPSMEILTLKVEASGFATRNVKYTPRSDEKEVAIDVTLLQGEHQEVVGLLSIPILLDPASNTPTTIREKRKIDKLPY